ncbi:MazG-like nucleotide pyrophosphohydrolase [Gordonia phage Forza]|uniref:MazG-like nucleotide pyrophosphohydrolase n=1 Tax=Gordonia phage Forza TaxID=2571247 RepID=A0A650EY74_9CAUD|nr:nucleoside triphosphate pyrophosphohydrolase [Gordonia phage Forza]QEM41591.1 MazG-like nucleotide pyrophosphohydrolase [Gordonia phage Boopy]QGT55117.1 MazG-like nucleotide pyrophosphohydrolase [Gordonia phage Forza]UXE04265.1 MazG-like nucleotide pyrophosphohydrolase [Gordonia phage BlueNGold]WBF03905.1 deoxyuridine triphosphatase [Gordonia phage Mareelih]
MTDGNWKWLDSTEELQLNAFGNDFRSLTDEARDNALVFNAYALIDEIGEALDETSWKPWDKKNTGIVNQEAFLGELVDAAHFLANLLLIGGLTEREFWEAYRAKQERNRVRQLGGYDSIQNKCPSCKRELDKPDAYSMIGQRYHQEGDKHLMYYKLSCHGCQLEFEYMVVIGENTLPGMKA